METNTVNFSPPFFNWKYAEFLCLCGICHKVISYTSTSHPLSPLSPRFLFSSTIQILRLAKLSPVKCFVFQVVFDQKC